MNVKSAWVLARIGCSSRACNARGSKSRCASPMRISTIFETGLSHLSIAFFTAAPKRLLLPPGGASIARKLSFSPLCQPQGLIVPIRLWKPCTTRDAVFHRNGRCCPAVVMAFDDQVHLRHITQHILCFPDL